MKINKIEKKNFIWNFLGLTINSFNSLFFLVIVNRINGENDAGIFTYAFSLISLLYFIGIFYSRTYQISNKDNINNKEFIVNRIISCIIMFIAALVLILIHQYNFYKSLIIISITLFRLLEAFADVLYGIEQKNNKLYEAGYSMFLKGIIGVIIFGLVDYITNNLLLACFSLSIINIFFILLLDIPKTKKYIEKEINKKNVLKIYKITYPIFLFSFLNIYLVNASKYMLDIFDTATIQNIYGIILMPGTILSLCGQYILNPYITKLSEYYNGKNYYSFKKTIKIICLIMIVIGVICEIACYFLGIPVLELIYGISLDKYKLHLMLVIFGAIFLAIIAVFTTALTIFKKYNLQMYIYIASSILSLILSYLLVKEYKITGACIEYSLIMFIQTLVYLYIYEKNLKGVQKNERKN